MEANKITDIKVALIFGLATSILEWLVYQFALESLGYGSIMWFHLMVYLAMVVLFYRRGSGGQFRTSIAQVGRFTLGYSIATAVTDVVIRLIAGSDGEIVVGALSANLMYMPVLCAIAFAAGSIAELILNYRRDKSTSFGRLLMSTRLLTAIALVPFMASLATALSGLSRLQMMFNPLAYEFSGLIDKDTWFVVMVSSGLVFAWFLSLRNGLEGQIHSGQTTLIPNKAADQEAVD